jgi:hypothetical protein
MLSTDSDVHTSEDNISPSKSDKIYANTDYTEWSGGML